MLLAVWNGKIRGTRSQKNTPGFREEEVQKLPQYGLPPRKAEIIKRLSRQRKWQMSQNKDL